MTYCLRKQQNGKDQSIYEESSVSGKNGKRAISVQPAHIMGLQVTAGMFCCLVSQL